MRRQILASLVVMALLLTVPAVALAAPAKKIAPSDAYLSTQFTKNWGAGAVTITDIPREGVRVDISGETGDKTGISDNFPVSTLSNCVTPSYTWDTDCTAFKKYELVVTNRGASGVWVNLYMNTGWTNPPFACVGAPNAWKCDTYWENTWTYVGAGKTQKLTLDFSNATAYNYADDPVSPGLDGVPGQAIIRLDQVSNIGFQVADFSDGVLGSATLIVNGPGD